MKKLSLLVSICALFLSVNAQEVTDTTLPKIIDDTLITSSGFKIAKGMDLKLGTGTTPYGDFRFIRINRGSMFGYTSTNNPNGANSANNLNRRYSGQKYHVVRVEQSGNKKHGYNYLAVINIGMVRYEVDADNAILSGELVVPEEFRPKQKSPVVQVIQQSSTADELAKLNQLYKDSVITKEEFDTQKKKILSK